MKLPLVNPRDLGHRCAVEFSATQSFRLVTTAWVLTEVADGLASRNRPIFKRLLDDLLNDGESEVVGPTRDLFDAGVALYDARQDKEWSLTDCISFIVMEERGLTAALTGDHHFEQAGLTALLAEP